MRSGSGSGSGSGRPPPPPDPHQQEFSSPTFSSPSLSRRLRCSIFGRLSVITDGLSLDPSPTDEHQARQAAWEKLSDGAKEQFFWPTPGNPRGPHWPHEEESSLLPDGASPAPVTTTDRTGEEDCGTSTTTETTPSPHFCLVRLEAVEVDHLELKKNRRRVVRALVVFSGRI